MELVSVRTGHRWVYDETRFDLLVSPEPPPSDLRHSVVWRRISDFNGGQDSDCALLRGATLQAGLESVAAEVIAMRADDGDNPSNAYKLRRWPPRALLGNDRGLSRAATLLLRRPLTIEALARHSGVALIECRAFVDRLDKAALLTRQQQTGASGARSNIDRNLFSMIRKRLGIRRRAE